MGLFFYIGTGCGLAAATGLRPFLPTLLAGALASRDLGLDFGATGYSFLESGGFLLAILVALVLTALAQRRIGVERFESGPLGAVVAGLGIGLGALLFAATLAQHGDAAWPGLVGGAACAALAQFATRGLLARTRGRLPEGASREALPVYVELVALALAGLSVAAPPVGYVALALLLWLLIASRRGRGQKFAGLRVLR